MIVEVVIKIFFISLEGIYLGGFFNFFVLKTMDCTKLFQATCGESSNLLKFLPSFLNNQCFLLNWYFPPKFYVFKYVLSMGAFFHGYLIIGT